MEANDNHAVGRSELAGRAVPAVFPVRTERTAWLHRGSQGQSRLVQTRCLEGITANQVLHFVALRDFVNRVIGALNKRKESTKHFIRRALCFFSCGIKASLLNF